ncbi:hypothetical protein CLSAP_27000 [Clostridium saccharoperbutylacetonicum]|nr:hypothetical protein CLSAP_27000 [Clostridium saccharoperbutylacetonicum]NSB31240.1 hypothetical protein [Clostridium saccharoperbutylacetonicum]
MNFFVNAHRRLKQHGENVVYVNKYIVEKKSSRYIELLKL